MARIPRRNLPDGTYHVTTRAVGGERAFRDDDDRRLFLSLLARAARRHAWRLDTFCLMTTHYHLLLACTREDLSDGFRFLNGDYARAFNERYGRRGHLFAGRFASQLVESEEHVDAARRYILLNPVKAGLCRAAAEWPWSRSRYGRDLA
jgi:putative transposase